MAAPTFQTGMLERATTTLGTWVKFETVTLGVLETTFLGRKVAPGLGPRQWAEGNVQLRIISIVIVSSDAPRCQIACA